MWLRGLKYDECIQPPYMPRPDLASINVNYRRIPILSIGKDIYCDSRLIIKKLAQLPGGVHDLAPSSAADEGTRRLFENWTIDGGIFANVCKLLPYWSGMLKDEKFIEDRAQLSGGRRMTPQLMELGRPEGTAHMRQAFELLEETFLADGRSWILGTEGPTTADIDAVWPFEWLVVDPMLQGALPAEISEQKFPKTFAYIRRFMAEVEKRKKEGEKPTTLDGAAMKERVVNGGAQPESIGIMEDDPMKLKEGDEIEVYASDYGFTHRDRGDLVGLTSTEVVIRNSQGLHLHFPRWNFRIEKARPKGITQLQKSSPKLSVPAMRLIYHPASPFSRKVFMTALELNLASAITLEKVVVCPVPFPGWSDNNDTVSQSNPLTKIPCLIVEGMEDGIYDSNIICEYLETLANVKHNNSSPAYWKQRTLHAAANGIMDAAVLIAYEKRIREPKGLKFDEWLDGQIGKVSRALDRLEDAVAKGTLREPPSSGAATADELAVVAAVGCAGVQGQDWKAGRPKLAEWFGKWEQRGSYQKTVPTKDYSKGESKI